MQLNPKQQQAVEYNDGHLLIVAGAGTGKTAVITQKIIHLVKSGLAKPEEILALTFTDNTALEMRDRVDAELMSGYVDMQISTFHAFCKTVLERYGLDIGISNQFKLFSDTESWLLLREHIYELNLDYYRPMANPTSHIYELIKHFSKCKDELVSPEEYLKYAESLRLDSDDANTEERTRLMEIANAYHTYNQLLLNKGAMDFGDQMFYTVKLLATRPNVLKALQNRYKYILVDEFQDVNWAQYKLVCQLSAQSKLTVVGDDDQSIYAFRGASVSNILRFKEDFPKAKEIVLTENYRSGEKILDSAYALIQNNNPDRLEAKLKIDKRLKASGAESAGFVEYSAYQTGDDEVAGVINKISELLQNPKTGLDDIAILVRANNHADSFINALEKKGLPYEFLASTGLYREPVVLDCFNFLKTIVNHLDSVAFFRLLRIPFFNLSENDLQKLTSGAKKKSTLYYEALKQAGQFGVSASGVDICNTIIRLVHNGMQESRFDKPTTILYNFLEGSGYLHYLTKMEQAGERNAIRAIHHLKQFLDFVSAYETAVPDCHVSNFVEHFETVLASGDDGKLYQPSDTPDSINLMTIHKAKGLEFKYVFLVNLVEQRFPSRKKSDAIELPTDLVKEQLPEGDSHYQEERRLFYVGLTRAKEGLFLSSAKNYGGERDTKVSRFLVELGLTKEEPKTKAKKTAEINIIKPVSKHEASKTMEFEYELPKSFSFSQVRSYDTCPYQYKLSYVLNIPTKGHPSFSFGQTLHSTLQKFYQKVQALNNASQASLFDSQPAKKTKKTGEILVPTLDELYQIYEECWIPDWYKSKHQREDYQKKGRDILKVFYATHKNAWTVPVALEIAFKVKMGEYLIKGRIDRMDKYPDGGLNIIDYKTGKPKEKLTGDDKDQLLIYQLAASNLTEFKNLGPVTDLTFYFLNDNIKTSFIGKDKELEKIQTKTIDTLDSIAKKDFTATPNKFVCQNCDFRDICDYRV